MSSVVTTTTTTGIQAPPSPFVEREFTRTARAQRFADLETARAAAGAEYHRRRAPTETLTRVVPREDPRDVIRGLSVENVLGMGDSGISQVKSDPIVSSRLDENTRLFLDDFQELLRDVQYLLQEKNISPHMQELWRDALELRREAPLVQERMRQLRFRAKRTAETARDSIRERTPEVEEGRALIQNLRALVFQMIMSRDFRSVSFDALSSVRDLLIPQMGVSDPTERTMRRDQLIDRLKQALRMIGTHENYRNAARSIFILYDRLRGGRTFDSTLSRLRYNADYLTYNKRLQKLLADTVSLVEEFTGPGSVEYLKREALSLIESTQRDPDLSNLLSDVRAWILDILDNPARVDEEGFNSRTVSLWDRAIVQARNYPQFGNMFGAASDMVKRVRDDPLLNKLVEDNRRVVSNLVSEYQGELRLNLDVIYQLRSLIVPMVIETVREVSLPRIEGVAATPIGKIEYAIDNLMLGGVSVLPHNVHLAIRNALQVDVENIARPSASVASRVIIDINKISARFTDILFSFKHLSLPFIHDTGSADAIINEGGNGIWIKIAVDILSPSHVPMIRVHKIRVWVSNIHITVGDSRLSGIYNSMFGLFKSIIRRQIEKRIALQLQSTIHALDSTLRGVMERIPTTQITRTIIDRVLSPAPGKLGAIATKAREMLPTALKRGIPSGEAPPSPYYGERARFVEEERPWSREAEWRAEQEWREREREREFPEEGEGERRYIYYPAGARGRPESRPYEYEYGYGYEPHPREEARRSMTLGELASRADEIRRPYERHLSFGEEVTEPSMVGQQRTLGDISGSRSFFEQRGRPFTTEAAAPLTLDELSSWTSERKKRRESRELILRTTIPRIIEEYPTKRDLDDTALETKRHLNEDVRRISHTLLLHRETGFPSQRDLDDNALEAKRRLNIHFLQIRDTLLWASKALFPSAIREESKRLSRIA